MNWRRRAGAHAGDLVGGVSAAFVLIPQALAYAILAGLPAERGLYVAGLAPVAAAFFASSPYLGTGPTALSSLLTFGALTALAAPGSDGYVALAALLALLVGAVRTLMGLARLGAVSYLISEPVLTGFTTGAAVVIIASQVPTVVDVRVMAVNPFVAAFDALSEPGGWHGAAIVVSLLTAVVIVGGRRIHRLFPSVMVAVVGAIAFTAWVGYDGHVVGAVEGGVPPFSLDLPWSELGSLLVPALVIAVVGFSEPASIARHYATLERTRWDPNRELISQGMANLAAGLGGGFPAGGSFSRSALVRAVGARTRLAGAITGLVVLALLPFANVVEQLPEAVLGASIIVAVVPLVQVKPFLEYGRYTRLQLAVALVTFVLTVAFAPHVEVAVVIGIGFAIGAHLWRELRVSVKAWSEGDALHLAPKGVLYFASAPLLEDRFGDLLCDHPAASHLVIHLDGLGRVDITGAMALQRLLGDAEEAGLDAKVTDVPPHAERIIHRVLGRGAVSQNPAAVRSSARTSPRSARHR